MDPGNGQESHQCSSSIPHIPLQHLPRDESSFPQDGLMLHKPGRRIRLIQLSSLQQCLTILLVEGMLTEKVRQGAVGPEGGASLMLKSSVPVCGR